MQKLFGVSVLLGVAVCGYAAAVHSGPEHWSLPMPEDTATEPAGDPLLDFAVREMVMPALEIVIPKAHAAAPKPKPCVKTVQALGTWADMHTGPQLNSQPAGTVVVSSGGCK